MQVKDDSPKMDSRASLCFLYCATTIAVALPISAESWQSLGRPFANLTSDLRRRFAMEPSHFAEVDQT